MTPEPYTDRWGSFFTAYVPIRGEDGQLECLLSIDMDAREFHKRVAAMRRALYLSYLVALLASLAVGVFTSGGSSSRGKNRPSDASSGATRSSPATTWAR